MLTMYQYSSSTSEIVFHDFFSLVMKITSNIIWLLSATLVMLSISACTRGVKETRLSIEGAEFSMLIASDASEFKDRIRERIIARYQPDASIHIVKIKRLKDIDPTDYDVVLIMDTCLAWSGFNPSLNEFLETHASRGNIVLFMTAGDPDWTFSYQGVDAITSASVMENEEGKLDEIVQRIDHLLESISK